MNVALRKQRETNCNGTIISLRSGVALVPSIDYATI